MDFTIVTPSYRQLDWLACCIASVADQEGVTVEHIVQDAQTEGFAEFAEKMRQRWPDREGYRRVMISEPDNGMYDAVNKGLKRGSGRICAYLNCDEQYLPGALRRVKNQVAADPGPDLWVEYFGQCGGTSVSRHRNAQGRKEAGGSGGGDFGFGGAGAGWSERENCEDCVILPWPRRSAALQKFQGPTSKSL